MNSFFNPQRWPRAFSILYQFITLTWGNPRSRGEGEGWLAKARTHTRAHSRLTHCSLQYRVTSRVQTMSFRFARLRILPIPLFSSWLRSPIRRLRRPVVCALEMHDNLRAHAILLRFMLSLIQYLSQFHRNNARTLFLGFRRGVKFVSFSFFTNITNDSQQC